ncbi:MAG: hypothetical protein DMG05_23310 [Acidobacteria bacterium]|nr:MAG: hypothetical protein DMG05_23310 [Acidobacteriota bacterium]
MPRQQDRRISRVHGQSRGLRSAVVSPQIDKEEKSVETVLSLMLAYAAGLKRLASLIGIIGLIESLN